MNLWIICIAGAITVIGAILGWHIHVTRRESGTVWLTAVLESKDSVLLIGVSMFSYLMGTFGIQPMMMTSRNYTPFSYTFAVVVGLFAATSVATGIFLIAFRCLDKFVGRYHTSYLSEKIEPGQ